MIVNRFAIRARPPVGGRQGLIVKFQRIASEVELRQP